MLNGNKKGCADSSSMRTFTDNVPLTDAELARLGDFLDTFNEELGFNSYVHTMVTGGGLHGSSATWVSRVYFDRDRLMKSWRKAVIALLRAALRAGQLRTEITVDQMEDLLIHLERCWWSIKVQSFEDKWHFLQYPGRFATQTFSGVLHAGEIQTVPPKMLSVAATRTTVQVGLPQAEVAEE
jgi:Putative transposase